MNDPEVTLKFNLSICETLLKGLQELPYKVAAPTVADLDRQVRSQMAALAQKNGDLVPPTPTT